jgi:hypothetical protein
MAGNTALNTETDPMRNMGHMGTEKTTKKEANSKFAIQRQLFARSERVKGIDFHPVEPWILTTLYSGMDMRNRRMDES